MGMKNQYWPCWKEARGDLYNLWESQKQEKVLLFCWSEWSRPPYHCARKDVSGLDGGLVFREPNLTMSHFLTHRDYNVKLWHALLLTSTYPPAVCLNSKVWYWFQFFWWSRNNHLSHKQPVSALWNLSEQVIYSIIIIPLSHFLKANSSLSSLSILCLDWEFISCFHQWLHWWLIQVKIHPHLPAPI